MRIGAFNTDPTSLMAGVSSLTSSSAVLSNLHSRFTQYTSFNFSSDYLSSEPGFGIFPTEDPDTGIPPQPDITATFRGKDIYVLFYNAADENIATEVAIFRMKQDLLDDDPDFSFGKFNTDASASDGKRTAQFNLTPGETDLLLGFYDSSLDIFQTADLNAGAKQITSPLTQTNASGAISTYRITANNGADRFFATTDTANPDLTLTTLPTGFSIATNTGVITAATNALPSTNTIRLVASNSLTASVATNTLTWTLQSSSLSFNTTTNLISAVAGVEISPFTFGSTGTSPTYTADGNLRGLILSTNGLLSGIPSSVGTNNVTITSSAGGQNGTTTFSLAVAAPTISVPAGELTGGQIVHTAGTARTVTLSKTVGFTDLEGQVSPTTRGVTFNGTNLVIAADAVPLLRGSNNINLTLTASKVGLSGASASTTVPLRIVAPTPTALVGPTEFEVDVGQAFSTTILSDAGTYGRMSFSNLPDLAGFANGQVSGINRSTGLPYEFAVKVVADSTQTYEGGGTYTNTNVIFRLRNTNPPYFSTTNTNVLASPGRPISPIQLVASNFPSRYSTPTLPPGLQRAADTITGTPTMAGRFEVPVVAYNSYRPGSTNPADEQMGTNTLILTIRVDSTRPTSVVPTAPGTITRNTTISTSDNLYLIPGGAENAGVRVAAYGLPPGISLDATTGKLFGTTGGPGSYTATVFIQNGRGWIKRTITLTVQ